MPVDIEKRVADLGLLMSRQLVAWDKTNGELRRVRDLAEDVNRWLQRLETRIGILEQRVSALEVSSGAAGDTSATARPISLAEGLTSRVSPEKAPGSVSAESGPSIERGRSHAVRQGTDEEEHEERPWPG